MGEVVRLQELSGTQTGPGTTSLFTLGGVLTSQPRVFWGETAFPHLDRGRAQLLLPSL